MGNTIMRPRSVLVLHMMISVVETEGGNKGFAKEAIRCVF